MGEHVGREGSCGRIHHNGKVKSLHGVIVKVSVYGIEPLIPTVVG